MQIFVLLQSGKTMTLTVQPNDSIMSIKSMVEAKANIPYEDMRIVFCGKQCEDDDVLCEYNVQNESTLHQSVRIKGGEMIRIYIKDVHGEDIQIEIESSATIKDLKGKIKEMKNLEINNQVLYFSTKLLNDDTTLDSHEIFNNATLHLVTRLTGGKQME